MSAAGAHQLRVILERRDPKVTQYTDTVLEGFKPQPDGSVVTTDATFIALEGLRSRYQALGRRIAKVKGGGKARRSILTALAQIDQGMAQFIAASHLTFSIEKVNAMEAARQTMQVATDRLRKIEKGLPKK
jgi:hypothetical protein